MAVTTSPFLDQNGVEENMFWTTVTAPSKRARTPFGGGHMPLGTFPDLPNTIPVPKRVTAQHANLKHT